MAMNIDWIVVIKCSLLTYAVGGIILGHPYKAATISIDRYLPMSIRTVAACVGLLWLLSVGVGIIYLLDILKENL